ncbi:MAG: hypothetical protein AMXMBFR23_06890 [Chloroflexota bacterium]
MFNRWLHPGRDASARGIPHHQRPLQTPAATHGDAVIELTEVIETLIAQAVRLESVLHTPGEDALAQREAIMATLQDARAWLAEAERVLGMTPAAQPPAERDRPL